MGHSANTFWERAAAYEALKRHISDERAIEVLDDLVTEEISRALELEAFAAPRSFFAGGQVGTLPNEPVAMASSEWLVH